MGRKFGKSLGKGSESFGIWGNVLHGSGHENLGTITVLLTTKSCFEFLELVQKVPIFHSIENWASLHFTIAMTKFAGLESVDRHAKRIRFCDFGL